ncbi:hypothetical protein FHS70_005525 [Flammeovirga yaeyamensis]|nr:hypothetical protein [Flammeovirga yaeyamensis]
MIDTQTPKDTITVLLPIHYFDTIKGTVFLIHVPFYF